MPCGVNDSLRVKKKNADEEGRKLARLLDRALRDCAESPQMAIGPKVPAAIGQLIALP